MTQVVDRDSVMSLSTSPVSTVETKDHNGSDVDIVNRGLCSIFPRGLFTFSLDGLSNKLEFTNQFAIRTLMNLP